MKILNLNILPLVILILAFGTCLSVPAQHGGKAEGRRVRFKPGTASAVFTDKVSGSLEIEYELEAQAGQELIVRVVSEPPGSAGVKVLGPNGRILEMSCLEAKQPESKQLGLPTPSHCPESNPQVLRHAGRTWSATLPQSGNFLLSVVRLPAGADGVSTYSLLIIVPPAEKHSTSQPLSQADAASLVTAMRKFIDALQTKDVAAFLTLFSRSRFFYANNPLNVMRATVSYSELEKDLRKKGDWYCTYLERCGGLDAFIDNIGDGEMWIPVGGAKFVRPGYDAESSTYVKWRKEGGKWVIDEIAYPQA